MVRRIGGGKRRMIAGQGVTVRGTYAKKAKMPNPTFKRGNATLELIGKQKKDAAIKSGNTLIKFRCRNQLFKGKWITRIRVVKKGNATRQITAEELVLLKPFKKMLVEKFGWGGF